MLYSNDNTNKITLQTKINFTFILVVYFSQIQKLNVQILRSIEVVQVDTYKYTLPYGHILKQMGVSKQQVGLIHQRMLSRMCRTNVRTKLPVILMQQTLVYHVQDVQHCFMCIIVSVSHWFYVISKTNNTLRKDHITFRGCD